MDSRSASATAVCFLIVLGGAIFGTYARSRAHEHDSLSSGPGVARSATSPPLSPSSRLEANGTAALSSRPADCDDVSTTVGETTAGATAGGPSPATGPQSALALAWAMAGELDPGMYPTAEGLWARTGELWSDQEFLSLTQDELHDLLAIDDGFGFHGPTSLLDILGPLPTPKDCEEALAFPSVQAALQRVCEAELYFLALKASETRAPKRKSLADEQKRVLDEAKAELMDDLDRVSSFKHWTTLAKAWRRWSE